MGFKNFIKDVGEIAGKTAEKFQNVAIPLPKSSKLDELTGGGYSALRETRETIPNLLQGKSIKSNLYSSVRTAGTTAGLVFGGPTGGLLVNQGFAQAKKSNGGYDFGVIASNAGNQFLGDDLLGTLGKSILNKPKSINPENYQGGEISPDSYYSSDTGYYDQKSDIKKYLLIGGLALGLILILKK